MRLKRVRLFGFKTFADRAEFNLEGGVVAVVGPNGCGKSNLVDAILWALGEGNARHLRAQTGQDVIFSGSSKRKAVGFAEVSLLFENEDGALPIDSDEVTVTRRLNRSGESDYMINRQACRLRDVHDLLADSGLGRAGYAIVGQKEIDNALSASAEERRAWIDEAAGVQRYRQRKGEAQRRLAQAQEHLQRVTDILNELEAQREPLRREAELAIRYKSLQSSLREVEVGLLMRESVEAIREIAALELRIEESLRLAREESARAARSEDEMQRTGAEISELEQELDEVRQLQQASLTDFERAESSLKLALQRRDNLLEQGSSLDSDGEASRLRLEEAQAELSRSEEEDRNEVAALSDLRDSLAGVGEESKALAKGLRDVERELEDARKRHASQLKLAAEAQHRTERLTRARRERKGIEGSLASIEKGIEEAQTALDGQLSQVFVKGEAVQESVAQIQALQSALEAQVRQHRDLLNRKASLEGSRRGIEATLDAHEGLAQGPRAVLDAGARKQLTGLFIPVAEAIEADREMALAIETALGVAANDLICDTQEDAKAAVEWLKQNRAGRATFQPIPLMRPYEPSPELRRVLKERGVLGQASALIRFNPRVRPVMESLLGRVLVVEDLDVALRLAKTSGWSRMVTQEGEVVHGSGAVTGGQSGRQSYGTVQRKADLAEVEREIAEIDGALQDFNSATRQREEQLAEINQGLNLLRQAHQEEQKAAQEARNFLQALQLELKSSIRDRDKLDNEIRTLENAPSVPPPVDLSEIEARKDAALGALAARSADGERAGEMLRDAENRVNQARQRVDAARRRLKNAQDAEGVRRRRAENLGPESHKAETEIELAGVEITAAQVRQADATRRLEALQEVRRAKLEESLQHTEDAKQARENARTISDTAHQSELARTRSDSRRATALQRLYEEYGLTEEDALANYENHPVPEDAPLLVNRLRRDMRAMGDVNLGSIEAFDRLSARFDELNFQLEDILGGVAQVEGSIRELDKLTRERFVGTFEQVQVAFREMFVRLFGGGEGEIVLSDPDHILDSGIEIHVTLPGKRRQALNLLSGGERALCTSAFLFALLRVKPSPLVVLDEVDAPLDGRNVERFSETLRDFTDKTQFIVITHNPTTIESATTMLGVSMQEPGVSMLLPVRLPQGRSPKGDSTEGNLAPAVG